MTDPVEASRPASRRRRGLRWWQVALVMAAVLALTELAAGLVGPNIEREAGTEERAFIKADQMYDRPGGTGVAILGSSETAGGLVPEVVEANAPRTGSVYNAALAGTFLPTYQEWSERVVVPAIDPEVVVIGLLPMTVTDLDAIDSAIYSEPRDAYSSAMDQITGGTLGDVGWRLRQSSDLIRYRPYLRQPALLADGLANTLRPSDAPDPVAGTGMDWTTETDPDLVAVNTGPDGEVYDYVQPSAPIDADPLGAAIYQAFTEGNLDVGPLDALVSSLEDDGIQPVLVLLPVDRGPLEAGGADLETLDRWSAELETWADDHGVPVSNKFTESWEADLFHDRNHLAAAGAQRLSEEIGAWLDDLCTQDRLGAACDPPG